MFKKIRHFLSEVATLCFRLLPVKNRVFFYTIRSNDEPLDNLKCVFDALNCKKVLFARMLPHSFSEMMRARYYLLTSRVVVTDDYIRYLRQVRLHPSQKVVQLWHAAGAFKRFGLDAPSRLTAQEERQTHDQYTDVIVSSEGIRDVYVGAFGVSMDIVHAFGVPRTDLLLSPQWNADAKKRIYEKHPELQGKTVYLYAPTFREDDGSVGPFDPQIDFAALDAALSEDELFVIRRHPVMKEAFFTQPFAHVRDLSDESTVDLLAIADVLVTDYSSLIFDAALLKIPMLFYCPDIDTYERSFYLRVPQDLPGEMLTDASSLPSTMRRAKKESGTVLSAFYQKYLSACDGQATARVAERIKSYLK